MHTAYKILTCVCAREKIRAQTSVKKDLMSPPWTSTRGGNHRGREEFMAVEHLFVGAVGRRHLRCRVEVVDDFSYHLADHERLQYPRHG
jgi:hypothetical protein